MKIHIYKENELSVFPVYAATAGIRFEQTSIARPEGYIQNQIFLVNSGTGILKINGERHILSENDLFYISANIPHEYYPTDESFATTFMGFFGEGFDKIKDYYEVGDSGVYKNKSRGAFLASAEKVYNMMDTACEPSALCALTLTALTDFFNEALKKKNSPIEEVWDYLENNYAKMITLDDILSIYPYSKSKLCREFREKYSATVFEALTALRLRHAKYMLQSAPHRKLREISHACGFNDVSYFCKMYKKLYGISPKG